MARKPKAQDDDHDWRAELAKAKAAKQEQKADWRAGREDGRPDDQKSDYGIQDHTKLMTPSPDPGPDDAGEELKRKQAIPDGVTPEQDEEKALERLRVDPDTDETLLPESVAVHQEQSLNTFRRARGEAVQLREGDEGFDRSEETKKLLEAQWRDNPAMLGVGRNIEEEPVALVRAADAGQTGGVDLAKRFNDNPGGGPGEGAPPALPAEQGQRHHMGAPWPGPLDPASSAPSPSPEPGPEPSQQWHEPQDIEFVDHAAAVRGTYGVSAEQQREAQEEVLAKEEEQAQERERGKKRLPRRPTVKPPAGEPDQDPSRNSAGKLKHSFVADEMIRTGLATFGDDPPDHGTLQQALLFAQRTLRAKWRQYIAENREDQPEEPEPKRQESEQQESKHQESEQRPAEG